MKLKKDTRQKIWDWLQNLEGDVSELKSIVQNSTDIDITMYKDWERTVDEIITELTGMKLTIYNIINNTK